MNNNDVILIPAHLGGLEVAVYVRPLLILLSEAANKHFAETYCHTIDKYIISLCISGSMTDFGIQGIRNVRLQRKQRTIKVEYVKALEVGLQSDTIRHILGEIYFESMTVLSQRLDSEKQIQFDARSFQVTLANSLEYYRTAEAPSPQSLNWGNGAIQFIED